jgi:hypothetical protein
MREIAARLEQLARDARAKADERIEREPAEAAASHLDAEVERAVAEAERRLHQEADRTVAEAVRVLERSGTADPQSVAARIADATGHLVAERLEREVEHLRERLRATAREAELESRGRLLAATEAACERIEAVDHAQERVARALSRLSPPSAGQAGDEVPKT